MLFLISLRAFLILREDAGRRSGSRRRASACHFARIRTDQEEAALARATILPAHTKAFGATKFSVTRTDPPINAGQIGGTHVHDRYHGPLKEKNTGLRSLLDNDRPSLWSAALFHPHA